MVNFKLKYGLPFCSMDIRHKGRILTLDNILIDTGSGGTILKMDEVEKIDISIDVTDSIESIQGVGGSEFVYKKVIDEISLGEFCVNDFKVEIGVMDYGFNIDGIIGINFLKEINAVIDLKNMMIKGENRKLKL
ncbi:MAG: retropepsin-like aspartic protease [Clostridiales bacterium]|nr:retropepsin-like aspartic protease [Clostridiales bacterium]